MRSIVGRVATGRREVNRYPTILRDRQNVEQLLEIGAMILVVAPRDSQRRHTLTPSRDRRLFVGPMKRHGRRVVVQFIQAEVEVPNNVFDQLHDERSVDAFEQPIQTPPQSIIIEMLHLG